MPKRKVRGAQNVSRMCLVCGVDNPAGLSARFFEVEGDELIGVFAPRDEHQSYPGRMHGGVVVALLDETIGRAINVLHPGTWGVTVEFAVRFRRPVPLDREVRCVGRITKHSSRLFEGEGEVLLADGSVAAVGKGKYLKMALGDITDEGFTESDWLSDVGPLPEDLNV